MIIKVKSKESNEQTEKDSIARHSKQFPVRTKEINKKINKKINKRINMRMNLTDMNLKNNKTLQEFKM